MSILPAALPAPLGSSTTGGTLTTDQLLSDIRQRGQLPTATPSNVADLSAEVTTDEGLLNLAGDELRTFILPLLVQHQSEFLLTSELVPVNARGRYRIPKRALGGQLRSLKWSPTGAIQDEQPLFQVGPEETEDFVARKGHYSVEGAYVILRDSSITTGSLRMSYWLRPSRLVSTSECWRVTDASSSGGVSTLTVEGERSLVEAASVDVLKGSPAYEPLMLDVSDMGTVTASGCAIADADAEIEAGDWLSESGQTCIVPLPEEYHPLLAQRVAVRALEILGFNNDLKNAEEQLAVMMEGVSTLLARGRVQGAPRKVRNLSMYGG